jgi:hypothetical protein
MVKLSLLLLPIAAVATAAVAQAPQAAAPAPAWTPAQTQELLDRTQTIRLAPDVSHLGAGERAAVAKLIEVGRIFQDVYEDQRHHQAEAAEARLRAGSPEAKLYRLFQGPIATTLDNRRVPFLRVAEPPPGRNVYPLDLTKEEYDAFIAANSARQGELTHLRSVVRRADRATLTRDLATLQRHPVLDTLHPGLKQRLQRLAARPNRRELYGLPYSVAYADRMVRAFGLLNEAADAVETEDEEFARFLRNRARDLLSDDYESGDAAWITGRFKNLNAQIGAYETYDDELSGHPRLLLAQRPRPSSAGDRGAAEGPARHPGGRERSPYERRKRVREDIPVGVYDVVADFGQSRGGNTATILPNESYLARRYGRTILLRANIMRSPEIFGAGSSAWSAAVAPHSRSTSPPMRTSTARSGTRSATISASTARATAATSTCARRRREFDRGDEGGLGLALRRPPAPEERLLLRRSAALALRQRHLPHAPEQSPAPRPALPDHAADAVQLVHGQKRAALRPSQPPPVDRL